MGEKLNLKNDLKQLERVGGRAGTDTIRLWEGYREQSYLWRALQLLPIDQRHVQSKAQVRLQLSSPAT